MGCVAQCICYKYGDRSTIMLNSGSLMQSINRWILFLFCKGFNDPGFADPRFERGRSFDGDKFENWFVLCNLLRTIWGAQNLVLPVYFMHSGHP